jgi:hypothetical protein
MKKINLNDNSKKIIRLVFYTIFILAVISGSFFGGFFTHKKIVNNYSVEAIVTEIIEDRNEVFFETTSGHIFYIVTEEPFAQFETYSITFNTMGTPTIEDD